MFKLIDIPIWCYPIALLIFLITQKVWKWEVGLLTAFIFLVLATTVIGRRPFEGLHFQPELFWSWKMWNEQKEQILANIIMFIPIGIFGGRLWGWKALIFVAGLSFVIEVLQLITARGLFEFDDVIHNFIGAAIGIVITALTIKLHSGE